MVWSISCTIFCPNGGSDCLFLHHQPQSSAAGEPCFDLELGTLKIGDGVTTYENLKAISGASAAHYEGVKAEGESDNDVILGF